MDITGKNTECGHPVPERKTLPIINLQQSPIFWSFSFFVGLSWSKYGIKETKNDTFFLLVNLERRQQNIGEIKVQRFGILG